MDNKRLILLASARSGNFERHSVESLENFDQVRDRDLVVMIFNRVCKKIRTGHQIYSKSALIWRNSFNLIVRNKN